MRQHGSHDYIAFSLDLLVYVEDGKWVCLCPLLDMEARAETPIVARQILKELITQKHQENFKAAQVKLMAEEADGEVKRLRSRKL